MEKKHWCCPIFLVLLTIFIVGAATPAFSQPMLKMVYIEADSAGTVRKLAGMGKDLFKDRLFFR